MISFWFKEIFQRVIYHQSSVTGKMRLISLIKSRIHRWLCCAGDILPVDYEGVCGKYGGCELFS